MGAIGFSLPHPLPSQAGEGETSDKQVRLAQGEWIQGWVNPSIAAPLQETRFSLTAES